MYENIPLLEYTFFWGYKNNNYGLSKQSGSNIYLYQNSLFLSLHYDRTALISCKLIKSLDTDEQVLVFEWKIKKWLIMLQWLINCSWWLLLSSANLKAINKWWFTRNLFMQSLFWKFNFVIIDGDGVVATSRCSNYTIICLYSLLSW